MKIARYLVLVSALGFSLGVRQATARVGDPGHFYRCRGRLPNGKKATLRCCGTDDENAFYTAAAYFDVSGGKYPVCEITNDVCYSKNEGNCH